MFDGRFPSWIMPYGRFTEAVVTRVLVTGATGFVGRHLAALLAARPDTLVFGTAHQSTATPSADVPGIDASRLFAGDLTDARFAEEIVREARPDWLIHLAAQASVPASWEDPERTLVNNLVGQLQLLEAASRHAKEARILVAGSAEEYGLARPEDLPLTEDAPLRPGSPYAVSKIAQDYLGLQYHLGRHLAVIRVRPFNLIGPGQSDRFALPSFARQIAEAEAGLRPPTIAVGNLDARRDYTDVRDAVRAYVLLLERGRIGEVYNVGGGAVRTVRELFDALCALARCRLEVTVDPARLRPADVPVMQSDSRKLQVDVGWRPEIPIDQSLRDILDEWRRTTGRRGGEKR